MVSILLFLALGSLIGFLLRKRESFLRCVDRITTGSIYLLLFLLGLSVGTNPKIVHSVFSYGLQSLILCSGAMAGSVLISYCSYRLFFRDIGR